MTNHQPRRPDLHHPDGSHRTTPATTSGRALERHERALHKHLAAGCPEVTQKD